MKAAKEITLWVIVLCAPFVSSIWSYEYWEALRDHLMWLTDSKSSEWGHEAVAVIMTLAVSVFAFVKLSILRGWDWWSTP